MNLDIEKKFWNQYNTVAGLDEVGRGPLAGPVVTACVVLKKNLKLTPEFISLIKDSKKISEKRRQEIFNLIKENKDIVYTIDIQSNKIIDTDKNILKTTLNSFKNCIFKLKNIPDLVLIDGNQIIPDIDISQKSIIQGDSKVFSIALASIIAKVTRDNIVIKYTDIYPEYGFEKHKGYGTKQHIDAILKYEVQDVHRKTYAPIKNMLKKNKF